MKWISASIAASDNYSPLSAATLRVDSRLRVWWLTQTRSYRTPSSLDDANLPVFLLNPTTGNYDTEVAVVSRDPANNTLTFQTDHFSTYGIGGEDTEAPVLTCPEDITVGSSPELLRAPKA